MKQTRHISFMAIPLLVLALAACAINTNHGTSVSQEQVDAFVVGKTTRDEVIAALGKPHSTRADNARTRMIYVAVQGRTNPPSFATLTGMSPANEITGTQSTLFEFDANGVLVGVVRRGVPAKASASTP